MRRSPYRSTAVSAASVLGLFVVLAFAAPAAARPPPADASRAPRSPRSAHGAPSGHAPAPLPAPPPRPLPMLASVARVRVEAARDRTILVEDVALWRSDWQGGSVEVYVAFAAPGPPIAIDARLLAATPSAATGPGPAAPPTAPSDARAEDAGDTVAVEPALRRPPGASPLLGRTQMAGVVLRVSDTQLRRAYAAGEAAILRVRSLLPPAAADAKGTRDVVVRLGTVGSLPLTVGRVQVVSLEAQPWITRAEASLCGPDADPWPLAVAVLPKATQPGLAQAIAPSAAVRHSTDDLCVRWWATP